MKLAYALVTLAMAGCTSLSDVVRVGDNKYSVSSTVRGGASWSEVKGLALKRANEYCESQGQELSSSETQTHGARGWTPQEAEVTFQCGSHSNTPTVTPN